MVTKSSDSDVVHDDRKRIFLGILNSDPVLAFVDLMVLIPGFFAIWIWAETRDDQKREKHKPDMNEVAEEMDNYLEDLEYRTDDAEKSLKQILCRLEAINKKSANISPDCLSIIKPVQPIPYTTPLINPSYRSVKRNALKNTHL